MRTKLADLLVRLARWIDPPNKATMQFIMDRCVEATMTGRSAFKVTAIDPEDYYKQLP